MRSSRIRITARGRWRRSPRCPTDRVARCCASMTGTSTGRIATSTRRRLPSRRNASVDDLPVRQLCRQPAQSRSAANPGALGLALHRRNGRCLDPGDHRVGSGSPRDWHAPSRGRCWPRTPSAAKSFSNASPITSTSETTRRGSTCRWASRHARWCIRARQRSSTANAVAAFNVGTALEALRRAADAEGAIGRRCASTQLLAALITMPGVVAAKRPARRGSAGVRARGRHRSGNATRAPTLA